MKPIIRISKKDEGIFDFRIAGLCYNAMKELDMEEEYYEMVKRIIKSKNNKSMLTVVKEYVKIIKEDK